ncbi:hypothetical protein CL630_01395 [bacterium]|nr:hypothetical protein [bacterium]|tara:strand:+ start:19177 stop:19593 length:417 start_codon:yes stop_codon:yes gene_type:complete
MSKKDATKERQPSGPFSGLRSWLRKAKTPETSLTASSPENQPEKQPPELVLTHQTHKHKRIGSISVSVPVLAKGKILTLNSRQDKGQTPLTRVLFNEVAGIEGMILRQHRVQIRRVKGSHWNQIFPDAEKVIRQHLTG